MVDKDKIKKIKVDKREKDMEREIERVHVARQHEVDALKDQLVKIQVELEAEKQKVKDKDDELKELKKSKN